MKKIKQSNKKTLTDELNALFARHYSMGLSKLIKRGLAEKKGKATT